MNVSIYSTFIATWIALRGDNAVLSFYLFYDESVDMQI